MHITIIHSFDPFHTKASGTDNYVGNLIDYLVSEQVFIDLIGVSYSSKVGSNLPYNFRPIIKKNKISGYSYIINLFFKSIFIRIPNNSIMHAQQPIELFPFIIRRQKNLKVCTLHGKSLDTIKLKNNALVSSIYGIIEKIVIKRLDKLIAVDESTMQYYLDKYPEIRDNIEVIPLGIDTHQFRLLDKQNLKKKYGFDQFNKIVMFVGRLEKEKNLEFLLKSTKILQESIEGVLLVIVGEGREHNKLMDTSNKLNINIKFIGTVERDTIPDMLNCADVLALTSIHESGPLVALEALACGVPVVSVEVGRIKEFIQDENTGIISGRDEYDFARSLRTMLEKGDVRHYCRNAAEIFSFNVTGMKTYRLYEELSIQRGTSL